MSATEVAAGGSTAIREFQIGFAESELTELRRRIKATRCGHPLHPRPLAA